MWTPERIGDAEGPWLLAEGFLERRHAGRRVFGFFRTLIVAPGDLDGVTQMIDHRSYLGNDFLPGCPQHHGIYAGEMPWSRRFSLPSEEGPSQTTACCRNGGMHRVSN